MDTMRAIFEAELERHGLRWCRGGDGCSETKSHGRGFVMDADKRTVHLDSEIATRSTLHRGLYEIAHCVHDERGLRRYECERHANQWAEQRMREIGISVPRRTAAAGRDYVGRMKQWGDNVRRAAGGA